jgi:hypothetical protein
MATLQASTSQPCSCGRAPRACSQLSMRSLRSLVRHKVPGGRAAPSLSPASGATESTSARPVVVVRSLFDNNNKNGDDLGDRIIAALPFLLPLLDGLPYGKRSLLPHKGTWLPHCQLFTFMGVSYIPQLTVLHSYQWEGLVAAESAQRSRLFQHVPPVPTPSR